MQTPRFTTEQALPRIKLYCAYQERCHAETAEKLYSFGLNKKEVDETIARLIEENYLNEERFAVQFAGGKFRQKQWGRIKIKYALKQKRVSEYCIKKALKDIDDNDYLKTLNNLAAQKVRSFKTQESRLAKQRKLQDYLLQKGYEIQLIKDVAEKHLA